MCFFFFVHLSSLLVHCFWFDVFFYFFIGREDVVMVVVMAMVMAMVEENMFENRNEKNCKNIEMYAFIHSGVEWQMFQFSGK